ncbi:coiled-coil domain-containing protein [Actinoplanes sp. GCM10030250]|uniref:coiled-coil domain-containing protein n=1 Tax=Actinoplanes sp. GCM10030250 TaxID=3273376 RepID=UPI00361474CE
MPVQDQTARRLAAVMALLVAVCGLAVAASPATAAPRPLAAPGENGDDGEGGSKSLIEQLEDASSGYVKAKASLKKSKQQQTDLTAELKRLDAALGPQQDALDEIAQQAYTSGRMGTLSALVTANSTDSFLDRVETLATVAAQQNAAIADLKTTRSDQQRAKIAIDTAVRDQQKQVNVMAKRKTQAETALKKANQGADAGQSGDGGGSASADPAPSNAGNGCSEDDPTSGGCITPRTLHALKQAKSDGFTRYVHCFREQNSGEHPKGRACDFAADKSGFGGDATGASKTYGNNLANYFINNAEKLDVLYVIWFRRIWLPSSGWKSYSGAGGDPSSDHTNHVHLSVN